MDKEKKTLFCSLCNYTAANNVNWFIIQKIFIFFE